jgi:hypothetical protein
VYHSALLTPYTTLASFRKTLGIKNPRYEDSRFYTSGLLNDFMEYKIHMKNVYRMRSQPGFYTKASDSRAYSVDPQGLDSAILDIQRQMSAITQGVDLITKNSSVAVEALTTGRGVYEKPSTIASRLPLFSKKLSISLNILDKPISALPSDDLDGKSWQWVHVPGWDSPDNTLFKHGDGQATPAEIMAGIYEWEALHPGHFARGFNMTGEVKSKVCKYKDLKHAPPGSDLYVRVLCDDQWSFLPGIDSGGHDISTGHNLECDIDILEALRLFTPREDVVAFNSFGKVKDKVELPLRPWNDALGKPHFGIWVRNSVLKLA